MIWILFIGLIVGAIAKLLTPGKDPGGWFVTMILGVAGAWLAHFIGIQAGWYSAEQPAGFVASIIGAILLLVLFRAMRTKKTI